MQLRRSMAALGGGREHEGRYRCGLRERDNKRKLEDALKIMLTNFGLFSF